MPKRDVFTDTWKTKTWSGVSSPDGAYIWTDGTDIYFSRDTAQYVLDKATSTWKTKTWSGLTSLNGAYIWTDGTDIFYSIGSDQYVLDKATSTWKTKTWSGLTRLNGNRIWTDGTDIYYSYDKPQYVLDKTTSTWKTKTWSGLTILDGVYIWTDGTDIYYSNSNTDSQYVLDKIPIKNKYLNEQGLSTLINKTKSAITEASQTATEASQSVTTLGSTVARHTSQIKSLDQNKASCKNIELEAISDLTAESFTQMVYQALEDYPSEDVLSITLNLNRHTFAPTEGSDIDGDYVIFVASGMAWNSDLPGPTFWAGTYGYYILFQPNTTHPTFGHFAFMWGNALDSGDPSSATVYFD